MGSGRGWCTPRASLGMSLEGKMRPPNQLFPRVHFFIRHCKTFRDAAFSCDQTGPLDYVEAISGARTFWPDCSDLFGRGPCNMFPQQAVFSDMTSARLPGDHPFARIPKVGPMSRALAASGALFVDAQAFRMCREAGALETHHCRSFLRITGAPGAANRRRLFP